MPTKADDDPCGDLIHDPSDHLLEGDHFGIMMKVHDSG
jgi:hypothetical protein